MSKRYILKMPTLKIQLQRQTHHKTYKTRHKVNTPWRSLRRHRQHPNLYSRQGRRSRKTISSPILMVVRGRHPPMTRLTAIIRLCPIRWPALNRPTVAHAIPIRRRRYAAWTKKPVSILPKTAFTTLICRLSYRRTKPFRHSQNPPNRYRRYRRWAVSLCQA